MSKQGEIICGDSLEVLRGFADESVDCVITSPPYWKLRDYGVDGQLGLEPHFNEYIEKLVAIFDEVKRVLKKEGTCWVYLGDTYNAMQGAGEPGTGQVRIDVKNVKQKINRNKDRTSARWGGGKMGVKEL